MPFLIIVQSERGQELSTRLVAPLLRRSLLLNDLVRGVLAPAFVVLEEEVFLNPFDLVAVPLRDLSAPVASFAGDELVQVRIQRALDEVLAQ